MGRPDDEPFTMFVDESGPDYDAAPRCVILGAVLCPTSSAQQLLHRLDREAADIASAFPAHGEREWKGSILGKTVTRAKRRSAAKRGEALLARDELAQVYERILEALADIPGTRVLALTAGWRGPTPVALGKDFRLSQATEALLAAVETHGLLLDYAYIDRGHETGYMRGFERFSEAGGAIPPYEWADSSTDRRVQAADLIAHLGRAVRYPANQHLAGIGEWLGAPRFANIVTPGQPGPDHHVVL